MGLKAGLSLYTRCTEYAKALGKSHILQTAPQKLNLEGLKVCAADTFTKTSSSALNVIKKEAPIAKMSAYYDGGQSLVLGYLPDNYVTKEHMFIKGGTSIAKIGPKKGQQVTTPDRWIESSIILPHYHIGLLRSGGAGSGTKAVQRVVAKSLEDSRTAGRVTLDACCIDGKTSPAGFYYKLGFRFQNQDLNIKLEEWLKNGGKRENSPFITGTMFLPKENIEQCLKYGKG